MRISLLSAQSDRENSFPLSDQHDPRAAHGKAGLRSASVRAKRTSTGRSAPLSVARQMPARASTAAACLVYRTKRRWMLINSFWLTSIFILIFLSFFLPLSIFFLIDLTYVPGGPYLLFLDFLWTLVLDNLSSDIDFASLITFSSLWYFSISDYPFPITISSGWIKLLWIFF